MREQVRLTQPVCLKVDRRPVATGGVMPLKHAIAAIHARERHWGVFRLAHEHQIAKAQMEAETRAQADRDRK